jgi:hypothetical protein
MKRFGKYSTARRWASNHALGCLSVIAGGCVYWWDGSDLKFVQILWTAKG